MVQGTCKCLIGNRELNKIKMIALNLEGNLDVNSDYKWKTDGKTILEIAKNLVTSCKPNSTYDDTFWKCNDLGLFNPYWNVNNDKFNDKWVNDKKKIKQIKPKSLHERFELIFGADPTTGTISAQNNIFMHKELGIETNNTELQAAIVFTMYARMLDKTLWKDTLSTIYGNGEIYDQYDGYLYKYLTTAQCAAYATSPYSNTLYLFAHGGITDQFVEDYKNSTNTTVPKALDILANLKDEDWKGISDTYTPTPKLVQGGGGKEAITDYIDRFNKVFQCALEKLFENSDESVIQHSVKSNNNIRVNNVEVAKSYYPSPLLQQLLALCAPVDKHPTLKYKQYDTKLSPIQTDSPLSFNLSGKTGEDTKVINIFGHIPKGLGYSFGKSGDNNYYISTDNSNSLMKDTQFLNNYDENYMLLYLNGQTGKFRLDGQIHVNLSNFPIITKIITNIDTTKLQVENILNQTYIPNLSTKFSTDLTSLTLNFKFDNTIDEILDSNYDAKSKMYQSKVMFHGIATVNNDNVEYYVYSISANGLVNGTLMFKKNLILLPFQDTRPVLNLSAGNKTAAGNNTDSGNNTAAGGSRKYSKRTKSIHSKLTKSTHSKRSKSTHSKRSKSTHSKRTKRTKH
jgi:hypothetical protein